MAAAALKKPDRPYLGGWRPKLGKAGATDLECRVCFEPCAESRDCCAEPLCEHCWAVAGFCPRCGVELMMVNITNVKPRPGQNLRLKDVKKPVIVGRHLAKANASTEQKEAEEKEGDVLRNDDDDGEVSPEDCPVCLGPGYLRKCCKAYFCNECYFRHGSCPGCAKPCTTRGFEYKVVPPGSAALAGGYCIGLSFLLACALIAAFVTVDEIARRKTVSGFHCYKWYGSCDRNVCIHLNQTNPPTLGDLNDWKEGCSNAHSLDKIRGMACVFDEELFRRSSHRLGYDLCWGGKAKGWDTSLGGFHAALGNKGKEFADLGGKFTGGAYVMEDDFDHWSGLFNDRDASQFPEKTYRSALWANMTNVEPSAKCGAWSGDRGLYFSGKKNRFAMTQPLDLRFGGVVNFRLKFGPEGPTATSECDSAFIGDLVILYETAADPELFTGNWTRWKVFPPPLYPNDGTWSFISLKLPPDAWSPATRFKFDQPKFIDRADHLSLDDLHVFHRFKKRWHSSENFRAVKAGAQARTQLAQCCLGSAQCSTRLTPEEKEAQCANVPGFLPDYDATHEPMNNTPTLFLFLAFLLFAGRWVFRMLGCLVAQFPGQEKDFDEARPPVKGCSAMRGPAWCSKRAYASSKIYTLDEGPPANAAYERRFFVEDDPSWRLRFVALYTLPLLLMAWGWCVYLAELGVFIDLERNLHILGKESMFNVPVPMVVFLAVALVLDAAPLWFVARDIVYASRDGVPVVDVDARPSMAACVISGPTDYEEIELKDFKYMRWVTVEDLRQLAALAVVGCWPFASLTLALHLSRLPFATARGVLPFFGTLTIIKAFVGGDVLIRAKWWFEWVFSRNLDDKDELGMYVKERRNLASSLLAMAFSFLVGLVFFLAIDIKAEWKTALFLSLLTLSSCYWGCLCGVGSGLPIEPRIFLTSLQEPGILLRYHRHANFNYPGVGPRICRHPGRHICVDMHSRDRLWILSVDDNQGLYEMLKGTDQTENTEF